MVRTKPTVRGLLPALPQGQIGNKNVMSNVERLERNIPFKKNFCHNLKLSRLQKMFK